MTVIERGMQRRIYHLLHQDVLEKCKINSAYSKLNAFLLYIRWKASLSFTTPTLPFLHVLPHKSIQLGVSNASASIYCAVPVKAGLRPSLRLQCVVLKKDPTLPRMEVIWN